MLRSGNISAFFGPRLTRLTGNANVQKELFKEILRAALEVPPLPPNPDHNAPATQQNIVWLLMWRHRLFEWIVREGLYAPWRVWYHPLWSNPVLFEHMQDLLGQAADKYVLSIMLARHTLTSPSIHRAFEEWCAKRQHKDGGDGDHKDGCSDGHDTHQFFVATPPVVVPKTDGAVVFNVGDVNGDILDDDLVLKVSVTFLRWLATYLRPRSSRRTLMRWTLLHRGQLTSGRSPSRSSCPSGLRRSSRA